MRCMNGVYEQYAEAKSFQAPSRLGSAAYNNGNLDTLQRICHSTNLDTLQRLSHSISQSIRVKKKARL
jgi:hypothetical protein|eukprot:COSAG01_NODE_424_length_17253_cov_31.601900_2_plen_68_part_00